MSSCVLFVYVLAVSEKLGVNIYARDYYHGDQNNYIEDHVGMCVPPIAYTITEKISKVWESAL